MLDPKPYLLSQAHLREIRHHLHSQCFDIEENVIKRGNCIFSFESKMGKDVGIRFQLPKSH